MQNRLEILRIFCTAAETKNFKEAAQHLGVSPQTVTRAIHELEQQIGELLFHRTTRQCRVTREGERLAKAARQSIDGFDQLFRSFELGTSQQIAGTVRITAPEAIGHVWLVNSLARLRRQYPELNFELQVEDIETDVVDEQIDIGIRHGVIRDSRFVARQIAEVQFYIVAAPQFFEHFSRPTSLEEMQKLPIISTIDKKTGKPWPWFLKNEAQWIPSNQALISNSTQTECAATLAGIGLAQLPGFLAVPHIRSGALVALLPELSPTPWAMSVFRPQRGPVPARIRVVYDWLVEELSDPEIFPV